MNILFISHIIPSLKHIEAANIVQHELLLELIKRKYKVSFLFIKNTDENRSGIYELNQLKGIRFNTVKCFKYKTERNSRNLFQKIFLSKQEDYFPKCSNHAELEKIISNLSPDYLLTIWDEKATDLISEIPKKKICYYGNLPPKNFSTILDKKLHGKKSIIKLILYIKNQFHKILFNKFHYQIIKKINFLFNVSMLDAEFYRKKNIDCYYINNVYKKTFSLSKIKRIKSNVFSNNNIKIVGNVGNINGTANSLGIDYLIENVFPKLKKLNFKFEIHLFGGGDAKPSLKLFSKENPELKIRGFVRNIDTEICTSNIFLCCNNASNYNVGHTRYLHAFSLGTCVVAHKNISRVMPEMISNENCYLGETSKKIAEVIKELSENKFKTLKLGMKGYESLTKSYSAQKAVDVMIKNLKN